MRPRIPNNGPEMTPADIFDLLQPYNMLGRARSTYESVYSVTGGVEGTYLPIERTGGTDPGDAAMLNMLVPGFLLPTGYAWGVRAQFSAGIATVSAINGGVQSAAIRLEGSQNLGTWTALEPGTAANSARAADWESQLAGNVGGNTLYMESVCVAGVRSFEDSPGFVSGAGNAIRIRAAWFSNWTMWSGSGDAGGILPDENVVTGGWNLEAQWHPIFVGV